MIFPTSGQLLSLINSNLAKISMLTVAQLADEVAKYVVAQSEIPDEIASQISKLDASQLVEFNTELVRSFTRRGTDVVQIKDPRVAALDYIRAVYHLDDSQSLPKRQEHDVIAAFAAGMLESHTLYSSLLSHGFSSNSGDTHFNALYHKLLLVSLNLSECLSEFAKRHTQEAENLNHFSPTFHHQQN